ncbi:tRNA pseudouridine synthase B [Gossypium arboreum]|uniref:tRNA pseudouridine synthase B n=1 Tax=Gossypium arboreum TaxID=29729 RepID=A0A0B0PXA4_GOSAR|nr:tRNA pseudouridine synthase B [Gossypium arboreum]
MVKIAIFAYELVELSPISLMGGLRGSLATYVALMCKLSMYLNYIPMCSTVLTSQLGNRKRSEARSHYPYTILA